MTQPSRSTVGLRSERGPVLLAIMLALGLVAIDSTILATAIPAIVRDLGSFAQFPWLFSIYLLAQAAVVPIYGKLADMVGRKPVMMFGVATFLLGSILCGLAWNMTALIAFRLVQGLGAGAIMPMALTMVGDLYSVAERAKIQGYLGSVWGIAAVVGPTLGGVFSDYLTWRWIFYVNIPVGLIAAWLLVHNFHEKITPRQRRIDYAGSLLLITSCTLLILGLLEGGVLWAWDSAASITVLTTGALTLVAFLWVESRAPEPIIPLHLLRDRLLAATNLASLVVGVLVIGLTSYIPLFAQHVLGYGAVVAGFVVASMSIGWPLSSAMSGWLYLRIDFRNTSIIGSLFVLLGAWILTTVGVGGNVWVLTLGCFVVGVGMGLAASPTLVAAQSYVGWDDRGVVTGVNAFFRSIGSAIGVAIFGAIVTSILTRRLGFAPDELSEVAALELAPALNGVFWASVAAAIILLIASALIPSPVPIHPDDGGATTS